MTINRCQICKVAWEDGQPAKHLMTCTIHDFLFFPSSHRKPTAMESLVMTAMAGWNIGEDRFEVARAVLNAMREPTTEMMCGHNTFLTQKENWQTMIDAASPRDE